MDEAVAVVLVGTGGYGGGYYVPRLLQGASDGRLRITGAVNPAGLPVNEALQAEHVPIYPDLETFFAHQQAELAILSGPIYTHCPQTIQALAHGAHVLCEKPAAATTQEVQQMLEAEARSAGCCVGVGFQWSFSKPVQELKRDIQSGRFGRPLRMKTLVLWPRAKSYYQRNDWAGKVRMPDGRMVLDSPLQNAMAHYFHNMVYLLGAARETSAEVVDLRAELFRANPIENYDTAALRCRTLEGVEILFYGSHCVPEDRHPLTRCEFEHAMIEYDGMGTRKFTAHLEDGSVIDYGDPEDTADNKILELLKAVCGGPAPACGLKAALTHSRCVELAQRFPIREFPSVRQHVGNTNGDPLVWIESLAEQLTDCFEHNRLLSEIGE